MTTIRLSRVTAYFLLASLFSPGMSVSVQGADLSAYSELGPLGSGFPELGAPLLPPPGGQTAVVLQQGNTNRTDVWQAGSNQAQVNQIGTSNSVNLEQNGALNQSGLYQNGDSQSATVSQSGDHNLSNSEQVGQSNEIHVLQNGSGNQSQVLQQGTGNIVDVSQSGTGLQVIVQQNGDYGKAQVLQQ